MTTATLTTRCWDLDGRCLNAEDARQIVRSYRGAYTTRRFNQMMERAINNGHPAECTAVFSAAIDVRVGQRVRTNGSFSCSPRDGVISQITVNNLGTTIYVLEDGGRFGRNEFRCI